MKRFPTNFTVTIVGVRPAAAISRQALAQKHALAMERIGVAMTTPELERWAAWARQWPFNREQLADLDDARTAAELDIAFVARRAAAGCLPAMAQA